MPRHNATCLPYLWTPTFRGRYASAYYRRGGATVRIAAPDGTPLLPGAAGFLDAYARIDAAYVPPAGTGRPAPAPPHRSIAHLVHEYLTSEDWAGLAPSTRKLYRRITDEIVQRYGAKSAALMPRSAVFDVRKAFAVNAAGEPTPSHANKATAVIRMLMQFAVDRGWRKDNPAARPGRLRSGDGFKTWKPEEFQQFMDCPAVAEPIKRAAALAWFTGMRIADCAAMPRQARHGGVIEVTPGKTRRSTGERARIPEHPDLTRILDAAPPADTVTLLTTATGKPWRLEWLQKSMAAARRTAGLPEGLSFHGLRQGTHAALALAGASDSEIEAAIPHASGRLVRHYRRHADRDRLAASAIVKLTNVRKPQ